MPQLEVAELPASTIFLQNREDALPAGPRVCHLQGFGSPGRLKAEVRRFSTPMPLAQQPPQSFISQCDSGALRTAGPDLREAHALGDFEMRHSSEDRQQQFAGQRRHGARRRGAAEFLGGCGCC